MFAPSPLNELTEGFEALLADDLDQCSLAPPPVELSVEDLLPRTEVELSARDRSQSLRLPPYCYGCPENSPWGDPVRSPMSLKRKELLIGQWPIFGHSGVPKVFLSDQIPTRTG
jgi:hypothetical protein